MISYAQIKGLLGKTGAITVSESKQCQNENGNTYAFCYSKKANIHFLLTIPSKYFDEPKAKLPAIIFLHSLAERGKNLSLLINNEKGQGKGIAYFALEKKNFDFVTISPLCPRFWYWTFLHARLRRLVEELVDVDLFDKHRLSLTGVSMGGIGTWSFAMHSPELFKTIIPISGGFYPIFMRNHKQNLRNHKIWAFHDSLDKEISIKDEINFVDSLKEINPNMQYTISNSSEHYLNNTIYAMDDLWQWILK